MGQRRQTPGRPATFVVTRGFLDHFGLGSEKDLPGLAELRAAGLIDNDGSAGPLFGAGAGRRRGGGARAGRRLPSRPLRRWSGRGFSAMIPG